MPRNSADLLFSPYALGKLRIPNRIVMAPLTRSRAAQAGVPTPLMAEHYAQRASAGLILAEAAQINAEGRGFEGTPGIYTEAQLAGWELITRAVHTRGGKIFLQLWHVGRISHTSLQPEGNAPVGPSAIAADAKTFTAGGFVHVSQPRALEASEIKEIVEAYAMATRNALSAGFDGVEVDAANGYLIDQFLRDGPNKRTDEYGGSIENRARLLTEVMQAAIDASSADFMGVRISTASTENDAHDSDPWKLFAYVVGILDRLRPVYLHVIERETSRPSDLHPAFGFDGHRKRDERFEDESRWFFDAVHPKRSDDRRENGQLAARTGWGLPSGVASLYARADDSRW